MTMQEANQTQTPFFERDGDRMPVLGLGTFQMAARACREAVAKGLDIGYRHIDTAHMYENESEVGAGIADSGVDRSEIFLTTKLTMGELHPDGVRESCDRSLDLLNTDYLDLLLIHWPETDAPLGDTLGAMSELRKQGKIRHVGVSNFTVSWLEKAVGACDAPIFCNQVEYHPFLNQDKVLDACRRQGIGLVAYSPLARGKVVDNRHLVEIGGRHGKSAAQVALRWLIEQPGVIAIPKGTSEKHIRENFDIFDFELSEEDKGTLRSLQGNQRLIDPDWAPDWDN